MSAPQLPTEGSVTEALAECINTLASHPGYSADTTFAEIWTWLARKDAAVEAASAALAKARGETA
jgi:hypothetical protein